MVESLGPFFGEVCCWSLALAAWALELVPFGLASQNEQQRGSNSLHA